LEKDGAMEVFVIA